MTILVTGGDGFIGSHTCLVLLTAGGEVSGVIHFAGLKAVGESVQEPLLYWDVDLNGSRLPIEAMGRHGCRTRFFNPVGQHPSGRIGEDPQGIPNDLFPFITQVASGQREKLRIFGSDWPTPDGPGCTTICIPRPMAWRWRGCNAMSAICRRSTWAQAEVPACCR
jgi:UDP-glucose 4-epimerase